MDNETLTPQCEASRRGQAKRYTAKTAARAVDEFNAKHPVGSECFYYPVAGHSQRHLSKTRSRAWVIASNMPVVLLEGRSGGIHIDHLALLTAAPSTNSEASGKEHSGNETPTAQAENHPQGLAERAVREMSDDALRIRVAELRGWKKCRMGVYGNGAPERAPTPYGFPPRRTKLTSLPNYPADLNACHETWDSLTDEQQEIFCKKLHDISCPEDCRGYVWQCAYTINATARQRAEAFYRTLSPTKEKV